MIRRLVEAHYFQHLAAPNSAQIRFWLQELRTPQLLVEVAHRHFRTAKRLTPSRPLLLHALSGKTIDLESALTAEEAAERKLDRKHWLPLRMELEKLRHARLG